MASLGALREWCRVTCADYPSVEVKNMTTSFRDGLAFCAIIHKHRPDLIDFSSLSKDNPYENNKLAFEVAETKLGIPALLDPRDMVSCEVPDCLAIITYLSQYYSFFNNKSSAGPASLRSSHITLFKKSKHPDGVKPLKRSTQVETSKDHLFNTNPQTTCKLCCKPVHLIQRHVVDGEVYHRRCFRCKVCHSTLLPQFYKQGTEAGFLICSHHITDSKSTDDDFSQQIASTDNQPECKIQPGYVSLSGFAITSIPHYTMTTESRDKLVCETATTEGKDRKENSREVEDRENPSVGLKTVVEKPAPLHLTPPSVNGRTAEQPEQERPAPTVADSKLKQEVTETQQPSELSSPCVRVTEGRCRPVPAPRRMLESSSVPVPAPRVKTSTASSNSPDAGSTTNQSKDPPISPHVTSPITGKSKVKANHPWLGIIHPGPWTQLPPAPSPVTTPRSKSIPNLRGSWYRPRGPPPNPFAEEVDEETCDEAANQKSAGQTVLDETRGSCRSLLDATEATARAPSDEAQSHFLPRSVSVPAVSSAHCRDSLEPDGPTEATDSVASCQSKQICKENQKPDLHKSQTFQALASQRAPAPGHGFPLIKRKVQTDRTVSTGDLQSEMGELNKQLEALEQRGVELEKNLRENKNVSDKEEEQMLMKWFSLIHERLVLVRRDTELVYLRKQQKLEEKQADVEYDLRCLLNKPESGWSQEDRNREQQLVGELVAIIEQRNQIISSLDQDRQREREEDVVWEAVMKDKELQKKGLKELKKSKGKLKASDVFKMLSYKAESSKNSVDKKS